MKKNYLMLLYTCLLLTAVKAQFQFRLGVGYQRTFMMDKQASPLKYQTSEKAVLLGYRASGLHSRFNVQINGSLGNFFPAGLANRQLYNSEFNHDGTPKNDSGSLIGTLYTARIKVAYSKQVGSRSSRRGKNNLQTKNFLGASLNNQFFFSDNFVRAGWLNATSVNAELEHAIKFGAKHSLTLEGSIPLLGRVTRLPYYNSVSSATGNRNLKTFFKQGSRFTWPGNLQNVQVEAGYNYALSKKIKLGIHYTGQWLHYTKKMPITLFQNNIGLTASIR